MYVERMSSSLPLVETTDFALATKNGGFRTQDSIFPSSRMIKLRKFYFD